MEKNVVQNANDMSDGQRSPALAGTLLRGLAVMDVLLSARQPMSLGEIAGRVELDQSTTLRLLRALEGARQVLRIGDGKRYLASPKAMRPLSLRHPLEQFRRESAHLLRQLSTQLSSTVVLVVFFGGERLVLDVIQAPGSLSPYYEPWLSGPLHASGPGKSLLLSLDLETSRKLLGPEPYQAFTDQTLRTWQALSENLEAAKKVGVITVRDEFYDGLTAVAANYSDEDGNVLGCIVVTGHSAQLDAESTERVSQELSNCARLMPFQSSALRELSVFAGAELSFSSGKARKREPALAMCDGQEDI
ncbi:IclR family transcriptional regulator [Pusillimonas sp. ANT_WB101]|uniref:IclR family transcriptional regulator n=1 Tax=Pusillimonas sp. ANT_WB101 TaxID=2597356 RepID=UPI0011F06BDB|nr:IclR family transcriptional regulator C-terminal domain-containing protein [Pusillimonas sp. ANT_WB101]KAA0890855.1 helix-turn-helix domain-containing protein [Pusillimonas sp. ANT_WB101]